MVLVKFFRLRKVACNDVAKYNAMRFMRVSAKKGLTRHARRHT